MAESTSFNRGISDLEAISLRDSPIHRIDPRAKLVTFLVLAACIVSFGKYELRGLAPYALFFAVVLPSARIPLKAVVRRIVPLIPLAVLMGIFNPIYDREALGAIAGIPITGGMVSFASILIKFVFTVSAAVTLVAVTGFNDICAAMDRMGVPGAFTTQLLLLHRYIFTLTGEASRMRRARDLRSPGATKAGLRVAVNLVGHLLLRTYDRAGRIHHAMLSRSWQGGFLPHRGFRLGARDIAFCVSWCACFVAFRLLDVTGMAGDLALGVFR